MTPAELEGLVARLAGKRVLCVGDLLLDRFVYGVADGVSREAPVVSLSERRRETMLGACGNVARNVAALGGIPVIVGVIGDDAEGHELSSLIADTGVAEVDLTVAAGRGTPVKTRYVSAGHQLLCVDRDPAGPIDALVEDRFIEAIRACVEACDIVVLSDYARGAVTRRISQAVIEAATNAGKRVIADPRGRDFTRYDGAFLLKPNALELSLEAASPVDADEDAAAALQAVMATTSHVENLLVTRGARGMALLPRGGEPSFYPSHARDVYDVSGAGDTTIAALALAFAGGADMGEAIGLANRAAGIVVSKVGTATVRAEELIADVELRTSRGASVASIQEAVERVARWRADGLRVGLTNGCFDILHVGHLSTLAQARALCDRLVVAVNADASVSRLKGQERPVNPQEERARLIAALAPVELVVIFEEDTATAVIEALRPDVYVKGGDYDPDALPEAPAMRALGVDIVIAPYVADRSTTSTIARLLPD